MNKGQKAFAETNPALGHLLVQIDTFYQDLPEPVRRAYDHLGDQLKYGCHVDLEPGQVPDECVINKGEYHNCVYAQKGMLANQCEYWRPIAPEIKPRVEQED